MLPFSLRSIFCNKIFGLLLFAFVFCQISDAAELQQKTVVAFNHYVAATEARFADDLRPGGPFLYIDRLSPDQKTQAYEALRRGELRIEKIDSKAPGMSQSIPGGIIHHWVGIVFIPGATLAKALPIIKDYDHRDEYYKPDVLASRTTSHQGDDYTIFLRLRQKKFVTAVLNTNYAIHWGEVDPTRVYSNSVSTRIAEVKDASKPDGEELPVGTGNGYAWRLNTYWRFEERDGGVYLQCEALSLSRDIPTGLGWLIEPMVNGIPKDSLMRILTRTRDVVEAGAKRQ
jgi:hypothetical protein